VNSYFPFLFGEELKDHVLVNNWANGWKLSKNQLSIVCSQSKSKLNQLSTNCKQPIKIVIVFWPQYLEFLGFGFLFIGIIFIVKIMKKSEH